MATITTSITGEPASLLLDINPLDPIAARAQIFYTGVNTVPAKIAANISEYELTCPLPANFVYRLIDLSIISRGPSLSDLTDFSASVQFQLQNASADIRVHSIEGQAVFFWQPGITDPFMRLFVLPAGQMQQPFRAAPTGGELFLRYIDASTTTTNSVGIVFNVRFLQYTIEQFNASPMHTPFPVLNV